MRRKTKELNQEEKGNLGPMALEMSDRAKTKIQLSCFLVLRPQRGRAMTLLDFEIIGGKSQDFQPQRLNTCY